jgi:hypothetical protein
MVSVPVTSSCVKPIARLINQWAGRSFSPISLFRNSEQGVWYDPSDFSTMFQDAAGTTPVTAVEQPVGRILDKSGRGNHATQSTPTSRPVLKQDETGRYYLLFDGTDDGLATATIDFTATNKMTVFAGVRKLVTQTGYIVGPNADVQTTNGTFALFADGTSGANSYRTRQRGTIATVAETGNTFPSPATNVVTTICSISDDILRLRVNGSEVSQSTADQGTGNFTATVLQIGLRRIIINEFPFNGRIYSLIVRGAESTAHQITNTETWVNARTGAY